MRFTGKAVVRSGKDRIILAGDNMGGHELFIKIEGSVPDCLLMKGAEVKRLLKAIISLMKED